MNNRTAAFVLPLLLLLLLTGCREKPSLIRTVTYMDQEYTVDQEKQTITHNGDVYHYRISGNEITLEYPNQATYSRTDMGGARNTLRTSTIGWSGDYDTDRYVPGDVLIDVLSVNSPPSHRRGNPMIGLLLLAVGLWNTISPYSSWYVSHGWRYKNAEPSDLALGLTRAGGIFAILLGVLMFFV